MRRTLALAVVLTLAVTARAPAYQGVGSLSASVASDGSAAAGWILSDSDGPDRIEVALGRPGALRKPMTIDTDVLPTAFWVIAEDGGGARIVWQTLAPDYTKVDPGLARAVRSVEVAGNGTIESTQTLAMTTNPFFVVTASGNEHGSVLATIFDGGNATLVGADPGQPLTTAMPLNGPGMAAAVAPTGAELAVGGACYNCDLVFSERPAGGSFGAAQPLAPKEPGDFAFRSVATSLASDGTAAVTVGARLYIRPPGGNFGSPISIAKSVDPTFLQARPGGGATLVEGNEIIDYPAGVMTPLPFTSTTVAATMEDGSVIVGGDQSVVRRTGLGPVSAPEPGSDPVFDGTLGVGLSEGGSLILTEDAAGVVRAGAQKLADYTTVTERAPTPVSRLAVVGRRLFVRHHRAQVPLRCDRGTCMGFASVGDAAPKEFILPEGTGTEVSLPVPRDRRRLHFTVTAADGPDRTIVRRLTAHRPVRCGQPWSKPIVTRPPATLAAVGTSRPPSFSPAFTAVLCTPHQSRGIAAATGTDTLIPGALSRRYAVVAVGANGSATDATRVNLRTGRRDTVSLNNLNGQATIERVAIADSGVVVIADDIEDRVRIRTPDHVIDSAPGIDGKTLRVNGAQVSWTRNGVRRQATLR